MWEVKPKQHSKCRHGLTLNDNPMRPSNGTVLAENWVDSYSG
jgi:hypothetical protein